MWSEADLLVLQNLSDTESIDAVIKDTTPIFKVWSFAMHNFLESGTLKPHSTVSLLRHLRFPEDQHSYCHNRSFVIPLVPCYWSPLVLLQEFKCPILHRLLTLRIDNVPKASGNAQTVEICCKKAKGKTEHVTVNILSR